MSPPRKEKIREKISYFRGIAERIAEIAADALSRGDLDIAEYIVSPNSLAFIDRLLERANAAVRSNTPWPQRKASKSIADASDLAKQVRKADEGPGFYAHSERDDEITSVNHTGADRRRSGGRRASDHAKKKP